MKNITIPKKEIELCIAEHSCLHGRKVGQVRSYLQFYKKKTAQKTKETICEERKREKSVATVEIARKHDTPDCVYQHFKNNILIKTVPTMQECIIAYNKSPTFTAYNPKEIQNFVEKAIAFNDSHNE